MQRLLCDLIDFSDETASASTVPEFKVNLKTAYSRRRHFGNIPLTYCMLSHEYLPTSLVTGAHLLGRRFKRIAPEFGVDDINDIRNGLLLFKPLEWAYDNSILSIVLVQNGLSIEYQACLQNIDYRDVTLQQTMRDLVALRKFDPVRAQVPDGSSDFVDRVLKGTTFGDIHGRILMSDGQNRPNPFKRVLDFQYKRSSFKADEEGWQHLTEERPDSHSTPPWQDNVMRYLRSSD